MHRSPLTNLAAAEHIPGTSTYVYVRLCAIILAHPKFKFLPNSNRGGREARQLTSVENNHRGRQPRGEERTSLHCSHLPVQDIWTRTLLPINTCCSVPPTGAASHLTCPIRHLPPPKPRGRVGSSSTVQGRRIELILR